MPVLGWWWLWQRSLLRQHICILLPFLPIAIPCYFFLLLFYGVRFSLNDCYYYNQVVVYFIILLHPLFNRMLFIRMANNKRTNESIAMKIPWMNSHFIEFIRASILADYLLESQFNGILNLILSIENFASPINNIEAVDLEKSYLKIEFLPFPWTKFRIQKFYAHKNWSSKWKRKYEIINSMKVLSKGKIVAYDISY